MGLLDLQQETRQAMHWITKETRESSTANGNITITPVSANVDTITFSTPTKSNVYYYLNGTKLMRRYPLTTTRIISQDITRLKFTKTANILTVEIIAQKTTLHKPLSIQVKEKVRIRNAN